MVTCRHNHKQNVHLLKFVLHHLHVSSNFLFFFLIYLLLIQKEPDRAQPQTMSKGRHKTTTQSKKKNKSKIRSKKSRKKTGTFLDSVAEA